MWLAWPPHALLAPLLLVGLVPLLFALNNIAASTEKRGGKRIFLTAGLTFLVWNTASIYWVFNAISAYNNYYVAFFVSLIPYGLGALLITFAFWLWYQLKRKTNSKLGYVGLISFYITMEFLHQSWDLAFPWMTLGNGFSSTHQLVQWYEFTGVYGGSLWILLSNILAYQTLVAIKNKQADKLRLTAIWIAFITIPAGYSVYRYLKYEEKKEPVNVVVVQPNINPYEKYNSTSAIEQLHILTKLSDSAAQINTEYFVWPETAMPIYADEDKIRNNSEFLYVQKFLSKYKNGAVITGIESLKWYDNKKTLSAQKMQEDQWVDRFNAAIQVENSSEVQFYHKSKLVPGVEKMPFPKVFSFLAPVFVHFNGSAESYGWQDKPGVFYAYSGIGVVPIICYESIWGNWVGKAVKDGGQLIAVITNDGWWGNTSGKDQHMLYAKLRALENRRYVVRSANTGISAVINQRGDVVKSTKWWSRTAFKQDVNLNDELTFYSRYGDLIAKLAVVLAIVLALIILLKGKNY